MAASPSPTPPSSESQPPRRSRRRGISRAGAVALALCTTALTAAPALASTAAADADKGGDGGGGGGKGGKPTVVLVHGAFADASGWNAVAERLLNDGYPVLAPANPLRSLTSDAAYVASVLKSVDGPIVLAGHSYGGAVIGSAAAGNPNVRALVYVSAFMPDKGETLGALSTKFQGSELQPALNPVPYSDGRAQGSDLYIKTDKFHDVFAADLPRSQTRLMAVEQRPIAAACFEEAAPGAAWRTVPSWFVVSQHDKAIAPNLERFQAERAKSTTVEVDSSHVSMMSHPEVVADQIRAAAKATATGSPKSAALADTGSGALALIGVGGLAGAVVLTGGVLLAATRRQRTSRR
ncbi:alpha/beta fold hydrolase [Streptomyces sp. NPDC017979]|uniref:alpha/beta fold hydrolase n=1 Tax=Streptomyces sp. NPDC017979 TaxID=3365024 RepID=UPI0037BBEC19